MRVGMFSALMLVSSVGIAQIPVLSPGLVVNAASFAQPGEPGYAVAPGSLVSIFGQFLGPAWQVASGIPLPFELGGVSVRFNGINAPLTFISPDQINAQLPWDVVAALPPGSNAQVSVVIIRNGLPSAEQSIPVAPFSPGIFALNGRQAVAVNASDGQIAQAAGSIAGLTTHAAPAGSVIILYGNGLGAVDWPVDSGDLSRNPVTRTLTIPTVRIGGVPATVLYSGLAPQFVGVNQLNVEIPRDVPTGDTVPVQIEVDGIRTSGDVTMAISP